MLYGKFKTDKQAKKLKDKLENEGKAVLTLNVIHSRFPYWVLAWDVDNES